MSDRITMNTTFLQWFFKSDYEEFFLNNDLILSWNNVLTWGPAIWHWINIFTIKQKIPTKTYCGINIINEPSIKFCSILEYDYISNKFVKNSYKKIKKQEKKQKEFIDNLLETRWSKKWFTVNFISENPKWHGLSFTATSSVLIATWLFIVTGKLDKQLLSNYNEFSKSKEFSELYDLAIKIHDVWRKKKQAWLSSYTTMINSSLPIISFSEKLKSSFNINEKIKTNKKIYDYKIDDFLWNKLPFKDIPLDYGIFYSGLNNSFENIEYLSESYTNISEGLNKYIIEKFKSSWIENFVASDMWKIVEWNFDNIYFDIISLLWFRLLKSFDELFNSRYDDYYSHKFIETINENWILSSIIENENPIISKFKYLFKKNRKFDNEELGIRPITYNKTWWSFLFVLKHNQSRDTFCRSIKEMMWDRYENLFVEYMSWKDWTNSDWIKIEQFTSKWQYSKYLKKDSIIYKNNDWTYTIWNIESESTNTKKWIVLDYISKKLYINWEKITSKQIHSQSTTVDIIWILLENIWKSVSNEHFPISSYSKNKNEMLWKIVLPFVKLIEDKTWKKISLTCKWTLREYYLKLSELDIPISVMKKI